MIKVRGFSYLNFLFFNKVRNTYLEEKLKFGRNIYYTSVISYI